VPSSLPNAPASPAAQKVNGTKDVQFFSVGRLGGQTLVIYMMKDRASPKVNIFINFWLTVHLVAEERLPCIEAY